jgi:hypothetical protein
MKKQLTHICLLFIVLNLHSQTPIETEVSKAIKLIEGGLSISDGKHAGNKKEFFLYCISLDSFGKIAVIDILRPDSISHTGEIRKTALELKEKWKAVKSDFKLTFIPVLVMHPDSEEKDSVYDLLINEMAVYFQKLNAEFFSSKVYVARIALVTYYR